MSSISVRPTRRGVFATRAAGAATTARQWLRVALRRPGATLLEGTEAGARANCSSPEIRILLESRGRATLFGETQIGTKPEWSNGSILGNGESTSQSLDLPKGTWYLSLQYFSPFALSITAAGFNQELIAAEWGVSENNRRAKYYTLTVAGRRRLRQETAGWNRLASAISTALNTTPEEV